MGKAGTEFSQTPGQNFQLIPTGLQPKLLQTNLVLRPKTFRFWLNLMITFIGQ